MTLPMPHSPIMMHYYYQYFTYYLSFRAAFLMSGLTTDEMGDIDGRSLMQHAWSNTRASEHRY